MFRRSFICETVSVAIYPDSTVFYGCLTNVVYHDILSTDYSLEQTVNKSAETSKGVIVVAIILFLVTGPALITIGIYLDREILRELFSPQSLTWDVFSTLMWYALFGWDQPGSWLMGLGVLFSLAGLFEVKNLVSLKRGPAQ